MNPFSRAHSLKLLTAARKMYRWRRLATALDWSRRVDPGASAEAVPHGQRVRVGRDDKYLVSRCISLFLFLLLLRCALDAKASAFARAVMAVRDAAR